jgi:hypothetical protein
MLTSHCKAYRPDTNCLAQVRLVNPGTQTRIWFPAINGHACEFQQLMLICGKEKKSGPSPCETCVDTFKQEFPQVSDPGCNGDGKPDSGWGAWVYPGPAYEPLTCTSAQQMLDYMRSACKNLGYQCVAGVSDISYINDDCNAPPPTANVLASLHCGNY